MPKTADIAGSLIRGQGSQGKFSWPYIPFIVAFKPEKGQKPPTWGPERYRSGNSLPALLTSGARHILAEMNQSSEYTNMQFNNLNSYDEYEISTGKTAPHLAEIDREIGAKNKVSTLSCRNRRLANHSQWAVKLTGLIQN